MMIADVYMMYTKSGGHEIYHLFKILEFLHSEQKRLKINFIDILK